MVFIPQTELAPAPPLPDFDLTEELRINRLNTSAFIAADPLRLVLRARASSRTATGAIDAQAYAERPEQRFKLIMQSPAGGSIEQRTDDATERQVDFVLLGEWNAQVAVDDFWEDVLGQRWEVRSLNPYNGYEIRANVEAHGRNLVGG